MKAEILQSVQKGELTKKEAYQALYAYPKAKMPKRAHFIKIKIKLPDEKGVNRLLACLFFMPLPLFIAKWALNFVKDDQMGDGNISKKDIKNLISCRGIVVDVKTSGNENIFIKTI